MQSISVNRKGEQGFTLVELAIVMIIIGLLITGILKGQEMIANAQVTSTISQMKGLDAAASTFRDTYNAFPGDMNTAQARLQSCTAPCVNGDGDGRLDTGVGAAPAGETLGFFLQMRAADLISGLDGQAGAVAFGNQLPTASVGGGYTAGHTASTVTGFTAGNMRAGHYLVLNGTAAAVNATSGGLNPSQAARIDRKMDDGIGDTGSVHGNTGGDCLAANLYNEGVTDALCAVAVRIQG
jgi:prepilin-type N-terminal cleavage/methylation domain-containing protein